MRLHFSRWRVLRFVLALLLSLSLFAAYTYIIYRPSYALYDELERTEFQQSHKWVNQTPRRYVKFRQLQGAGFNNQAQEVLLFHHLALSSSRTYVYQPLVWRARGEHSLVPLSAFLQGPTRDAAISDAIFDYVCPPGVTEHVRIDDGVSSDLDLWRYAMNTLSGHPAKCIVVDDWILNWNYLASSAIHSIWPSFKDYLAKRFRWSERVMVITRRAQSRFRLRSGPRYNDGNAYMALHFRRGDFEEHCHSLARDKVGFTTWATLPLVTNSVFPPALDSLNGTSTMEHCYPDISRIVAVIDMYARARPHLRQLHVLHDGSWDHPLVYYQQYRLEAALKSSGRGWPGGPMKQITHSSMLPIKLGEADFAVAVDVELARNAEVFIGNGFSSLSSQVLALRLGADDGSGEDITLL